MKYLVIVESPAKKQKIQNYLNAVAKDHSFIVMASMGHIRKIANGLKSIDMNSYEVSYSVDPAKRKNVNELIDTSKKVDSVILATDQDREGEAISFHLAAVLKLKPEECLRMTFNEITQSAIKRAFENMTELNINLFQAQEARAVLDLLIGYEISPVLWRYIQSKLSAGRCQSPALRLIYDREQEIAAFKSESYYQCSAKFHLFPEIVASYDGNTGNQSAPKKKTTSNPPLTSEDDIRQHLPQMVQSQYTLKHTGTKDSASSPSAPYITSTVQQDASSKFGMNPKITMKVLQTLYEKGYITYMRTDSTTMSETAHREIAAFIHENYKGNYHRRDYKKKVANAQEAHECIRPVKISTRSIDGDASEKKLYEMVWTRTVASQMKASKEEIISIQWKSKVYSFSAGLTRIIDPGYKVLYGNRLADDTKQIDELMKALQGSKEDIVDTPSECMAEQKYTRPASRYTEASLIRELEERGIGRPSTFASIVSTLLERNYVAKDMGTQNKVQAMSYTIAEKSKEIKETMKEVALENDKNKLLLTPIGRSVCEFLHKHFSNTILDYDFTKSIEENLDEISRGETNKKRTIDTVYSNFHPIVEKLLKDKKETRITNHNLNDEQKSARSIIDDRPDKFTVLGKHPQTSNPVYLHYGRYGTCIAELEDDGKLKYYSIPASMKNAQITLDVAMSLMLYPRIIGKLEDGTEIVVKSGPYGFYVEYGSTRIPFAKLDSSLKPETIEVDDIADIIEDGNVGTTVIKEYKDGLKIVRRNEHIYIQKAKKEAKWDVDEKTISSVLKKTLVEYLEVNGKEMGKARKFYPKKK